MLLVTHDHNSCRGCGRAYRCLEPYRAPAGTCRQGEWCPACWEAARHTSVSEALAATRMYLGKAEPQVRQHLEPPGTLLIDSERSSFEVWEAGVEALVAEVHAQQTLESKHE